MFKRILAPVDGSKTSALGLDEAIKVAKSHHGQLCILHVVDERVLTQSLEGGGVEIDRLLDSLCSSGKEILSKAAAKARARGVRAKTVMVENIINGVADVIVKQAKRWKADLIVIGTHGRRGVTRLVMGSDAEGVVRAAPAPVLLVRSKKR